MVEDQNPWRKKAEEFHEDLTEAVSCVVDYQRSLQTLRAADPHRNRTDPLMEKYGVPIEPHPHNNWSGRHGTISTVY
jgi:hypothetical protein